MRAAIKRALFKSGHYHRRIRKSQFPGVLVLCYHQVYEEGSAGWNGAFAGLAVTPEQLRQHCRILKETCHPVSLDQWRAAIENGGSLPERAALLSFDDGFQQTARLAMPVLRECGVPAVMFVATEAVVRGGDFWFDAVAERFGADKVEALKSTGYGEWWATVGPRTQKLPDGHPNRALTVDEIQAWTDQPGNEVGAHTHRHPILAQASRDEQRQEIEESKRLLEGWLGKPVRAFAYPNGRPGADYSRETMDTLAELGFDMAFAVTNGFARPDESALQRARFLVMRNLDEAELAHRLAYSWRKEQGRLELLA